MNRPLVFVSREIPEPGLAKLRESCEVRVHSGPSAPSRDELLSGVAGAAGILSMLSDGIDAELMNAAGEQLKVVANFAVGFNNIDLGEAKRRGICVGNTPDVLTDATADIAVGLLLSAARRFSQGQDDVRQGRWRTWEPMGWIGQDLAGKTIGLVGMGRIAAAVAARLHGGWGMRVLYTARNPKPDVDQRFGASRVELDQLLAESDFLSLHVPLTDQTRGMIGASQLAAMKSTAVLVNTARGEVIDQDALIVALRERKIAAAGLDVCTPEPLPTDNALLGLDNCQVLPHIGSATTGTREAMSMRAAENVLAGLAGTALPYPVQA